MKAIIIGHGGGGSYVLDQRGDFRFVPGHTTELVGVEIDVHG